MNYTLEDWYNELYRIFSCNDSLITQTQAIKVGECLRALAAGENIVYKLEDLYQSFRGNKKIKEPLENYMHQYTDNLKKDSLEQSQPKLEEEENDYGSLSKAPGQGGSTDSTSNNQA